MRIPPRTDLESWLTVRKSIISPILSPSLTNLLYWAYWAHFHFLSLLGLGYNLWPYRYYYINNFSYRRSSFELLIEFCLLIWIHEIGNANFLNIPKWLYHIINLIFKIICRKKVDFMYKIEHFTYRMKENNQYNIKRTWSNFFFFITYTFIY